MNEIKGTSNIQNICVYCGSGGGRNPAFLEAARAFGRILATSRIGLVYGGGSLGLMGEIARSVLDHGGHVTGIIPGFLSEREHMLIEAQELIVVDDMHQRKHLMFVKSDAFVALPGGLGTLEEFVEQLTWAQLGRHMKPIILANIEGYWDPLIVMFDRMSGNLFIRSGLELKMLLVDRVEDIVPTIQRALRPYPDEFAAETEVTAKF
ncbi:MAG: TIGR00730 family Rossman fold protein [Methyloceanibacter sp.]|uniref:LOG family protein n=1 Tax=Methyloceanibacter sp. TaxID=1965321 RepID=UPI003D6CBFD0